jgi:orotate phosphoribosyltransferase
MAELDPRRQELARGMLEEDIVKFGSFTLKDKTKSVAYVNLREMISLPKLFDQATVAYAETIRESGLRTLSDGTLFRFLSAVPEAATP